MSHRFSRRNWLKASALLSAGAVVSLNNLGTAAPNERFLPTGEVDWANLNQARLRTRLNANENPYGPSSAAKDALRGAIDISFRYPFAEVRELKAILAEAHDVTPEHIIMGGGSSEILTLAGMAFGIGQSSIVSAHPTFRTLLDTATQFDCEWIQVPLNDTLHHNLEAMEKAVKFNTRLVYVCNPNNPTGTLLDPIKLREFCIRVGSKAPIFIDEAYTEFLDEPARHTMIPLIGQGHDIIVAKTFSKIHGFAGLRVGYGIAPPNRVKEMEKYQISLSTISFPAVKAAMASFKDIEFQAFCKKKNTEVRNFTYQTIKNAGYKTYVPSSTSFVLFQISMDGPSFLKKMEEKGVGVRAWKFNNKDWCRVSIGTQEDMESFGHALKSIS